MVTSIKHFKAILANQPTLVTGQSSRLFESLMRSDSS